MNNYIWLYNNDDIISQYIINSTEFYLDNNNQLTIKKIIYSKITFDLPFILFASNWVGEPIETKLTNDYINDSSIDGNKLINL